MKAASIAAIIILLSPAAGALWSQESDGEWLDAAGNGKGASHLPVDLLGMDVLGQFNLWNTPVQVSNNGMPAAFSTPHGLLTMVWHQNLANTIPSPTEPTSGACILGRINGIRGEFEELRRWGCENGGKLVGWDASHDVVLLSIENPHSGTNAPVVLHAINGGTWTDRWQSALQLELPAPPATLDYGDWAVAGTAPMTDGHWAIMYANDDFGNRLQKTNMDDGTVTRAITIVPEDLAKGEENIGTIDIGDQARGIVFPISIASMPSGVLATVRSATGNGAAGWVWLTNSFIPIGGALAEPLVTDSDNRDAGTNAHESSVNVATRGDQFVGLIGNEIAFGETRTPGLDRNPLPPLPLVPDLVAHARPVWLDGTAAIPRDHRIYLQSGPTDAMVEWRELGAGNVQTIYGSPSGHLIAATLGDDSVWIINPSTGQTIQRLPLAPVPTEAQGLLNSAGAYPARIHLLPAGDGHLIALDPMTGSGTMLGQSDPAARPQVFVNSLYPGANEQISLRWTGDAEEVSLAWGDGFIQFEEANGEAQHQYREVGDYTASVTSRWPDGTTSTTTLEIHVGGTPPQNWLQQRFTAENQDTTWGIIGVLLVAFGAIITLGARRIGRSRISKGLGELASIRDRSSGLDTIRELQDWHRKQERRMLNGRLTEDQFRVLENRGARLMRGLVNTALESVSGAFPQLVTQRLEAAYADGFVDAAEIEAIRSAATRSKLPAAKMRVLSDLLAAWS